jgi:hypothetical protein
LRPRLEWNYSGHVIQAAPSVPHAIVAAANDFSLCGAAAFQIAAFGSFQFEMCKWRVLCGWLFAVPASTIAISEIA